MNNTNFTIPEQFFFLASTTKQQKSQTQSDDDKWFVATRFLIAIIQMNTISTWRSQKAIITRITHEKKQNTNGRTKSIRCIREEQYNNL